MQKTTINALKSGDRFYRLGDKQKNVWEIVPPEKVQTFFQTAKFYAKQDADRHATVLRGDIEVVFLRNSKNESI